MILVKYIIKEACKNQLIVLIILFLVCVCQKFLKMLNLVLCDNISMYLVLICIGLNIPELGKLIIPFSVFISVPITFYRLHMHNEILAMYVCGVDKCVLIRGVLLVVGIISIFSGINMSWLSPYCGYYQNKLLSEINKNVDLFTLTEKKFQFLSTKYLVLFVDNIKEKKLNDVFLVRKSKNALAIIIAEQGDVYCLSNGLKLITLKRGVCYEIYNRKKLYENICISNFFKYQVCLDRHIEVLHKKHEINYMSMLQLWNSFSYEAHIELHWRLTLLISIIILPTIAALLFINISSSYLLFVVFLVLFSTIFFLLHILLCFYMFLEVTNRIMWIWGINIFYIVIALILNLWNSLYIKRVFFLMKFYFQKVI